MKKKESETILVYTLSSRSKRSGREIKKSGKCCASERLEREGKMEGE